MPVIIKYIIIKKWYLQYGLYLSFFFAYSAGVPTTQPSPTTVIEEATTAESQQSTSGISSQHAFTPTDSQQATTQADVQQATTQADLQQSTNGFSDAPSTLAVEVYTAVIGKNNLLPHQCIVTFNIKIKHNHVINHHTVH